MQHCQIEPEDVRFETESVQVSSKRLPFNCLFSFGAYILTFLISHFAVAAGWYIEL
jgi:hypothetical protein